MKRRTALLAATLILSAGGGVAYAATASAAPAVGKSCSPQHAVYTTATESLLCARTPSDKKYRWRTITMAGPAGPPGPQGVPGPKGEPGSGGAGLTGVRVVAQEFALAAPTELQASESGYEALAPARSEIVATAPAGTVILNAVAFEKVTPNTFAGPNGPVEVGGLPLIDAFAPRSPTEWALQHSVWRLDCSQIVEREVRCNGGKTSILVYLTVANGDAAGGPIPTTTTSGVPLPSTSTTSSTTTTTSTTTRPPSTTTTTTTTPPPPPDPPITTTDPPPPVP